MVAGAAALLLENQPYLTPDQVKGVFTKVCSPVGKATAPRGCMLDLLATRGAGAQYLPAQTWPPSTGRCSLQEGRGSVHVSDTVAALTGENDAFGPFSTANWAAARSSGTAWSGGTWLDRGGLGPVAPGSARPGRTTPGRRAPGREQAGPDRSRPDSPWCPDHTVGGVAYRSVISRSTAKHCLSWRVRSRPRCAAASTTTSAMAATARTPATPTAAAGSCTRTRAHHGPVSTARPDCLRRASVVLRGRRPLQDEATAEGIPRTVVELFDIACARS
jgi:hypothetical protein